MYPIFVGECYKLRLAIGSQEHGISSVVNVDGTNTDNNQGPTSCLQCKIKERKCETLGKDEKHIGKCEESDMVSKGKKSSSEVGVKTRSEKNPETNSGKGAETNSEKGEETNIERDRETDSENGEETNSEKGEESNSEKDDETNSEKGDETNSEKGDKTNSEKVEQINIEKANETNSEKAKETSSERQEKTTDEHLVHGFREVNCSRDTSYDKSSEPDHTLDKQIDKGSTTTTHQEMNDPVCSPEEPLTTGNISCNNKEDGHSPTCRKESITSPDGLGQRQDGLGRRQDGLGRRQDGLGRRQDGRGWRQGGLGRRQDAGTDLLETTSHNNQVVEQTQTIHHIEESIPDRRESTIEIIDSKARTDLCHEQICTSAEGPPLDVEKQTDSNVEGVIMTQTDSRVNIETSETVRPFHRANNYLDVNFEDQERCPSITNIYENVIPKSPLEGAESPPSTSLAENVSHRNTHKNPPDEFPIHNCVRGTGDCSTVESESVRIEERSEQPLEDHHSHESFEAVHSGPCTPRGQLVRERSGFHYESSGNKPIAEGPASGQPPNRINRTPDHEVSPSPTYATVEIKPKHHLVIDFTKECTAGYNEACKGPINTRSIVHNYHYANSNNATCPVYEEILEVENMHTATRTGEPSHITSDQRELPKVPPQVVEHCIYSNVVDDIYDEIYESLDKIDSVSSFEPPWAQSVGKKGDVFYVEPGTTGATNSEHWSSEPPPGGTNQNNGQPHHHNGLNNWHPHSKTNHHSTTTTPVKANNRKGLKKKVKGIIAPRSKQNNNNSMEFHPTPSQTHHNGGGAYLSNGVARNNYRNQLNHSQHTVTFNDVPTGVTKDVRLYVDPHRHNYGRRATLCETLFGVVPGAFGPKSTMTNGATEDRRIMVQGLLPGGEALCCGQIKIGDWLMSVNDLEVNFDNLDSLLSAITSPMEVKLTLQKLAVQPVSPHNASTRPSVVRKSPLVNEALVRLVSGDRTQIPIPSVKEVPHSIMFLTLSSSEDGPPKQDVLYQYPEEDSKLMEIRGLFLTLGSLLPDVTDNIPRSSSMLIDNRLVHIAYAREGQQVLVIALPADHLTLVQVNQILDDVVRLLRILYGSLKSAFSSAENAGRLDHFFSLLAQRTLLRQDMVREGLQSPDYHEPLLELLAGVRALHLPEETKVIINNTLSDFEAADFADMSDDYYDMRRAYTIMGSALFYKGYLLSSHLHREDLKDAALYLRYHCLLSLCHSEQMGQMVVWKEVFPWRRCHVQTDPLLPGYTEPEARWFLLAVGLKNIMLTVLLEAGGASSWAEGHPTTDPLYVDQAKGSLLQLEALDIPNQCEIRLQSAPVPSLASVDWFFPSTKGIKEDPTSLPTPLVKVHNSPKPGVSPSRKLLPPESILKKRGIAGAGSTPSPQESDRLRPPLAAPRPPGALYDVESDADSHSTGNSDGSTPVMDRRGRKTSAGSEGSASSGGSSSLFKGQKKKRTLLSAYDVSGLKSSLREANMEEGSFVKLTSGCDNTLFHYVYLDTTEGVFICPTQQELLAVSASPTHSKLLANFHMACMTIRHVFHDTAKKQSVHAVGRSGPFGAGSAFGTVREHGILFHCTPENWADPKKAPPIVSYWVVGRQLPEPYKREMYVCFQDSAQQNLIELAFKMGFGILV